MSSFGCVLWWLVLGSLLGWLASWIFGKRAPVTVEKFVDRPVDRVVDRVVEKIVDRPVDRVVEKLVEKQVDNPLHLSRISALEGDVALMAGLRTTINQLQSTPPRVVEKIVEKIVDRPVDRIVEKTVEKIVARPVDRIVEKIIDRPVDRIVEKLVDNPAQLARIKTLETEVALIAGLRGTISQLQSAPPKVIEKIVDRPVEKVVEKIVEKIVDRHVDRPVDRVVQKLVDNPAHLARIKTLEHDVGVIAGLRGRISQLESAPPKTVEKIVEKVVEKIVDRPVDRIVEKIIDRPVERIVEKIVDRPIDRIVEKTVEKIVDRPVDRIVEKVVEKLVDNPAQLARIATLEAELATLRVRSAVLDRSAVTAAGFKVRGMDDLEVIEGIGPKIAELFHAAGIRMFWELAQTPQTRMQEILDQAGPNYKLANPSTWAQQASLAAGNRWADLRKLQDELNGGIKN